MKVVGFDTETCLITDYCKAPLLVCASFAWTSGETRLVHWTDLEPCHADWFVKMLEEDIFVGANTAFDFGVLVQQYPDYTSLVWQAYEEGRVEDVLLRHKLIDIADGTHRRFRASRGGYSLAGVVKRTFGVDMEKDEWRLKYSQLRDKPVSEWPQGAVDYAIYDAVATLGLYQVQQDEVPDWLEDAQRQARAGWWLHLASAWGITTDLARVDKLEREVREEYQTHEETLKEYKLVRPDGSRNTLEARTRMLVVSIEKRVPIKLTAKGKVSVDRESCKASGDDPLESYAEATHLKKLLATDLKFLKKGQNHTRFDVLVDTGRTSSSSPNIQNLSRRGGVRECFVPRPGFVFIDADYDTIELRTLAQVCIWAVGESRLAELLNQGFDPHLDLGAKILGLTYEDAVQHKNDPVIKEARQLAKPANFGFPGGMGAKKFLVYAKSQYGIEISLDDATALRRTWFENWPEVQKYFGWIRSKHEWNFDVASGGDTATVRHFQSGRYRGSCFYTAACNSYFQGLAADVGKAAGYRIARACYDPSVIWRDPVTGEPAGSSPLFGSRNVAFVHDQFVVETPDTPNAHDAAEEVGRIMVEEARKFLPDLVVTCTPALARRWSKNVEAVFDKEGRLTVWDEKQKVA
jgi:DNA polymerase-1